MYEILYKNTKIEFFQISIDITQNTDTHNVNQFTLHYAHYKMFGNRSYRSLHHTAHRSQIILQPSSSTDFLFITKRGESKRQEQHLPPNFSFGMFYRDALEPVPPTKQSKKGGETGLLIIDSVP